jgi:hypothetical protein
MQLAKKEGATSASVGGQFALSLQGMRRRSSRRAIVVGMAGVAAAAMSAAVVVACGGRPREVPVASLSSKPAAERAFEAVRDAWERYDQVHDDWNVPPDGGAVVLAGELADDRRESGRLRVQLAGFLATYPDDGLAPVARAYLAFVEMEEGSCRPCPRGARRTW